MDTSDKSISNIVNSLSHEFYVLSKWFRQNLLVLNPDKCSFMISGIDDEFQTDLVCANETLKKTVNKKKY